MRKFNTAAMTLIGGAILVGALVLMQSPTVSAGGSTGKNIPFTTIEGGQISGFGGYCNMPLDPPEAAPGGPPCHAEVAQPAIEAVIRDTCAWESLWAEHVSIDPSEPPAPIIDFDRFVVVAVVAGPRPNGCYETAITKITKNDGGLRTVHVVEGVPCDGDPCPPVVTNPFHFVRVNITFLPADVPVCFENRFVGDAQPHPWASFGSE